MPGSIPMASHRVLFKDNGPMEKGVASARCGEEGILWIKEKPTVPGYTAALFKGGSYHTYDINFYYASIRENARLRTREFMKQH